MTEQDIRGHANRVIEEFRKTSSLKERFGYDRESIAWVDGFIERERQAGSADSNKKLSKVIGCYLGECIVLKYGGQWRTIDGNCGVFFDSSNAVFPLEKARKQFERGREDGDSILGMYDMIGPVFFGQG